MEDLDTTAQQDRQDRNERHEDQGSRRRGGDRGDRGDRQSGRQSELEEKLIYVARVTKVVKGGRRFSFSAGVVVGDRNGSVSYGRRKAKEPNAAKDKASRAARKVLKQFRFPIFQKRTIHHDVCGRSGSAKVLLRRAKPGTGIIAGPVMRSVLEQWGVSDVVAKSFGSSNPSSVINATLDALSKIRTPKNIAEARGKQVPSIFTTTRSAHN